MTLREAFPEIGAPVVLPAEPLIPENQTLIGARRLIEAGWVQGHSWLSGDGVNRYCLLGAIVGAAASNSDNAYAQSVLASTINPRRRHVSRQRRLWARVRRSSLEIEGSAAVEIVRFNDRPTTTQQDVLRMLDRAIERSER